MQYLQERNFNERYSTTRGSLNNRLLPCPSCSEDGMLTAAEIKAGKICDSCVEEGEIDGIDDSDYEEDD